MRAIVRGVDALFDAKKVSSVMRWMPTPSRNPSLRLHRGRYVDGRLLPYQDEGEGLTAVRHGSVIGSEIQGETSAFLPHIEFQSAESGRVVPLFWQANQAGALREVAPPPPASGALGQVLLWGDNAQGRPVAVFRHCYLKLSDPRRWYQHLTAGDQTSSVFNPAPTALASPADGSYRYSTNEPSLWAQSSDEYDNVRVVDSDRALIFIHGYRMQPWERRAFAESTWKRMYWQGYGGRFMLVSWPTEWVPDGPGGQIGSPANYDRSEYQARLTGSRSVAPVLPNLYKTFVGQEIDKTIFMAHSMGNIVYSTAARNSPAKAGIKYIAMMSADPACAYKIQVSYPTPSASASWLNRWRVSPFYTTIIPDVHRFDAPRPVRQITPPFRSRVERLRAGVDGLPYSRRVTGVTAHRVAGINDIDYATAAIAFVAQHSKTNGIQGWSYRREARPALNIPPSLAFVDKWLVQFGGGPFGADLPPQVTIADYAALDPRHFVSWSMGDANEAAILSFLTPARSRVVGALDLTRTTDSLTTPSALYPWGSPISNSPVEEGLFTEQVNFRARFGLGDNELEHSRQFNYTIQKNHRLYEWLMQEMAAQ